MPVVRIGHHPELTVETAMEVFQRHFAGKYVVYRLKGIDSALRDIGIKKGGWRGICVKLEQGNGKTSFVFNTFTPSLLLRVPFRGLPQYILGRKMQAEFRSFVEGAREFK